MRKSGQFKETTLIKITGTVVGSLEAHLNNSWRYAGRQQDSLFLEIIVKPNERIIVSMVSIRQFTVLNESG